MILKSRGDFEFVAIITVKFACCLLLLLFLFYVKCLFRLFFIDDVKTGGI